MQVLSQIPHPLRIFTFPSLLRENMSMKLPCTLHCVFWISYSSSAGLIHLCSHASYGQRRQMCYNFFCALIFANAVYNDGCFPLPNCVWSGGSSLQYHTGDGSCRLKPEPPFPGQPQPGAYGGTGGYILLCKGRTTWQSGSSTDGLQTVLYPDL